jgi:hypothetical protein
VSGLQPTDESGIGIACQSFVFSQLEVPMKSSIALAGLSLILISLPSFALEVNCVRDDRAVDGDRVAVNLKVDAQGAGIATLTHEGMSPAISFSEKVILRALTCRDQSGQELSIRCEGINDLNLSEMEIVSPGGAGFSRKVVITTSYKKQTFHFGRGPIGTGAIKNGCDITK